MGTGYLVYELLAAQAGVLLIAAVTVGLAAWLVSWRLPGPPARAWLDAEAAGPCLVERLAWPAAPARQADPDARGGHRPRAPDPLRAAAA
jgi:hypothetical protein